MLNYRSYAKNKTGGPFFWTTLYMTVMIVYCCKVNFIQRLKILMLSKKHNVEVL